MTCKLKKKGTTNCILLRHGKSAKIYYATAKDDDMFSYGGDTYFIIEDGIYLTKEDYRIAIYLEGISTPVSHKNVDKEILPRQYKDGDGKIKTMNVHVIKGLKYDSEIIDILLNRKLAEKFTHIKSDALLPVIALLTVVNLAVLIITFAVLKFG